MRSLELRCSFCLWFAQVACILRTRWTYQSIIRERWWIRWNLDIVAWLMTWHATPVVGWKWWPQRPHKHTNSLHTSTDMQDACTQNMPFSRLSNAWKRYNDQTSVKNNMLICAFITAFFFLSLASVSPASSKGVLHGIVKHCLPHEVQKRSADVVHESSCTSMAACCDVRPTWHRLLRGAACTPGHVDRLPPTLHRDRTGNSKRRPYITTLRG